MKKPIAFPILYGEAMLADKPPAGQRTQMLAQIQSGELEYIDVPAAVFKAVYPNRNFLRFQDEELPAFASSFKDQPFLRNHDQQDIGARDGIINSAELEDRTFVQTLRITTRSGMTDYVEGRIDRFSIGWHYKDIFCTICNSSWFQCPHWPGREYDTPAGMKLCELIFTQPRGKETSAVNTPAVEGTGLLDSQSQSELETFKLSLNGGTSPADHNALKASTRIQKGAATMKVKVRRNGVVLDVEESEVLSTDERVTEPNPILREIESNRQAAAGLLNEQERIADLERQRAESDTILIAQLEALLDQSLANSRLPERTQKRLRAQFKGRKFQPVELSTAIQEAREEISELTASGQIQGPGRVSQMFNSADMIQAAMDDLLEAPREQGAETLKAHRFNGIRDAYIQLTGDNEFTGGYDPLSILAMTFPAVIKNSMNKRLIAAWGRYDIAGYGWWKSIATVEKFDDLKDVDWMVTGTIASLPIVERMGEYTELPIGDNVETISWVKYGGYVGIALEDILRDNTRAFKKFPDEVALGGIRNISEQVAGIFTSNSAAGPTMADGGALFNATAVTTVGGHANLLTTALGTDYTAWEAAASAVYNQPMLVRDATGYAGTGKKQALDPKFWLGPRALRGAANNLFVQRQPSVTTNSDWYGTVTPLTVPEFTDATDWAAAVDPTVLPGVMIGHMFGVMPQVFVAGGEQNPAMFANDESRIKVRQFLNVGVANWRALHKNNVA